MTFGEKYNLLSFKWLWIWVLVCVKINTKWNPIEKDVICDISLRSSDSRFIWDSFSLFLFHRTFFVFQIREVDWGCTDSITSAMSREELFDVLHILHLCRVLKREVQNANIWLCHRTFNSIQTHKQTNKSTNQQTNKSTNKQTNERFLISFAKKTNGIKVKCSVNRMDEFSLRDVHFQIFLTDIRTENFVNFLSHFFNCRTQFWKVIREWNFQHIKTQTPQLFAKFTWFCEFYALSKKSAKRLVYTIEVTNERNSKSMFCFEIWWLFWIVEQIEVGVEDWTLYWNFFVFPQQNHFHWNFDNAIFNFSCFLFSIDEFNDFFDCI